jgi:hypothetical protein
MTKTYEELISFLPAEERKGIQTRAHELATLYDLRRAANIPKPILPPR